MYGQLRGCFAANWTDADLISVDYFCWTVLELMTTPRRREQCLEFACDSRAPVWFHGLGRLGRSSSRDILGPVREAGVRHRRYARLSLARTRIISRKACWMLHRELPTFTAFPKG